MSKAHPLPLYERNTDKTKHKSLKTPQNQRKNFDKLHKIKENKTKEKRTWKPLFSFYIPKGERPYPKGERPYPKGESLTRPYPPIKLCSIIVAFLLLLSTHIIFCLYLYLLVVDQVGQLPTVARPEKLKSLGPLKWSCFKLFQDTRSSAITPYTRSSAIPRHTFQDGHRQYFNLFPWLAR